MRPNNDVFGTVSALGSQNCFSTLSTKWVLIKQLSFTHRHGSLGEAKNTAPSLIFLEKLFVTKCFMKIPLTSLVKLLYATKEKNYSLVFFF